MNLHTTPENKLFSTVRHGLFTPKYEQEIQKFFAKFQVLEQSFKRYQAIPVNRKSERLKQSATLFRVYWQKALKTLLPFTYKEKLNSQRLFMRYCLLHLTDLPEEELDMLETIALHTRQPSFIYYLDEWFYNIGTGAITPLQKDSSQGKDPSKKVGRGKKNNAASNAYISREATAIESTVEKLYRHIKCSASPFLQKSDLSRPVIQQVASREAVQKVIDLVRSIDPQVFTRKLLKETIDLEPYVILVPSYANFGICWEAFDRLERSSSRGRIVMPLYAPDTQRAVLVALANYRWETAKLAAGGYWLEKGLTGNFYDLYRKLALSGRDENQAFIAAYCQWILDESRGQIKLNPELRRFFWYHVPFEKGRSDILIKYFRQFRDMYQ